MAVHLEWHTSLPVLQATYQGKLTASDYRAMYNQRSELLESGPNQVVLVMNMQRWDGFPDAPVGDRENILLDARVFRTLVVIPEDLYSRLSRAILTDQRLPVHFFSNIDQALDAAESLVTYLS